MVQGALKLILEPIFEADFQPGSYGYRPKRTAHEAVSRVAEAIVTEKTKIIDLDLRAYFDNVQHYLVLEKVAKRVQDDAVMRLLKMILKATGKKGVPQGGVVTPWTQKITWVLSTKGGEFGRWRSARSGTVFCLRDRDGMANGNALRIDQNFLDQQAQNLLSLTNIQRVRACVQFFPKCA